MFTYTCIGGKFEYSGPDYVAKCPATSPVHGSSCDECADRLPDSCNYKYCGMYPSIYARCDRVTRTWNVMEASCNPPPPSDAGGADPGDPSPSPP